MSEKDITKINLSDANLGNTDLLKLSALKDEDIDYSDIPEATEAEWKLAKTIWPEHMVTLDDDIYNRLKIKASDVTVYVNSFLRSHLL